MATVRQGRRRQQQQHEQSQHDAASKDSVPSMSDPSKMRLTQDELNWAYEIRAAIKNAQHLKNLSDYECAQWAVVTVDRQDLDEVLDRAYKLQCFVEEHKLHQDLDKSYAEEGCEIIQGFCKLMPGYLLELEYMPNHGHYLVMFDKSCFTPDTVVTPQDWTVLLGAFYFIGQLMNSHLAAVRQGVALINECLGMGFHNFSASMEERLMTNLLSYLPFIHKESMWLNSPTAANVLMACLKPFLGDEMYRQIKMGCKLDGIEGSISVLYSSPTPEKVREALFVRIYGFLQERESNCKNYRLPLFSSASQAST